MGGDLAAHVLHDGSLGGACFAARKSLVDEMDGFPQSYDISQVETEFLTRCVVAGEELWIIPRVLYESYKSAGNIHYNRESGNYLRIRPLLEELPYSLKRLFLRLGQIFGSESVEDRSPKKKTGTGLSFKVLPMAKQTDTAGIGMGIICNDSKGMVTCLLHRAHAEPGQTMYVRAHGRQVSHAPLREFGEEFLAADWTFNLPSPNISLSMITFVCDTASRRYTRTITAIWGNDGTVHIVSPKRIVAGDVNEENARLSLPPPPARSVPDKVKRKIIGRLGKTMKRRLKRVLRQS
jgi:hypothetical protein